MNWGMVLFYGALALGFFAVAVYCGLKGVADVRTRKWWNSAMGFGCSVFCLYWVWNMVLTLLAPAASSC